jgi:hypothetical protein
MQSQHRPTETPLPLASGSDPNDGNRTLFLHVFEITDSPFAGASAVTFVPRQVLTSATVEFVSCGGGQRNRGQ